MRDNDSPKAVIIKCLHCGNETPMQQKGEYSWGSRDLDYPDLDFYYNYEMFACPVCHKVTLRETYSDETMIGYWNDDYPTWENEKKIIYPVSSIENASIPAKIKDAYEAALKTKNIDKHIGAMALRRTLELILIDKGATKWGLKDKIEEIAQKGLLPETLKEASSLTKILGDSATHDKEIKIDEHDVESLADFIQFIIEYLYIIPNKIDIFKEKLVEKAPSDGDK